MLESQKRQEKVNRGYEIYALTLGHPLLNLSGLARAYVPAVASKPRALERPNIILDNEAALEIDSSRIADIVDVPNTDLDCLMPQGENWLTIEEIAKDLKVNVNTVRRWIQSGELVALDVGGEYRVSREHYEDFIQRRKTDRGTKR